MKTNNLNVVIGGAGFIGFNLMEKLAKLNQHVIVIDDFSNSVDKELFKINATNKFVQYFSEDINQLSKKNFNKIIKIARKFKKINLWHLAANSDIRASILKPTIDLDKTLKTTLSVISLAQHLENVTLIFSSSSAVYGDQPNKILSENEKSLLPNSNYGITKLASEMFLKNSLDFEFEKLIIFRFPNILGTPSTHGVVHDWINQVKSRNYIQVLGDGSQQKQFMNVKTLIECMTFLVEKNQDNYNIFNIGPNDEGVNVLYLMEIFQKYWKGSLDVTYQKNNIGWRGDVNRYQMDVSKIKKYGWRQSISTVIEVEKSIADMIKFIKS